MLVAALVVVFAGAAVPQSLATLHRSRAIAAARYLAGRASLARMEAARRSASVALRFQGDASDITFGTYVDGNRNGVRSSDIAEGVDRPLDAPVRLADLFPGVGIGLTTGGSASDPVQLGSSNLLSFSTLGTATSGSVYVRGRDGTQLVVRILGATGRIRALRFAPRTGAWVDAF